VAATSSTRSVAGANGRAINIGSGQLTSPLEILGLLNRLLRIDAVPRPARLRAGPPSPARADLRLAAELLGWAPRVSLVNGLANTVQFFCEADQQDEPLLAEVGSHEERSDF
jgi:nucleoside-diphosphate-sugar epimerase